MTSLQGDMQSCTMLACTASLQRIRSTSQYTPMGVNMTNQCTAALYLDSPTGRSYGSQCDHKLHPAHPQFTTQYQLPMCNSHQHRLSQERTFSWSMLGNASRSGKLTPELVACRGCSDTQHTKQQRVAVESHQGVRVCLVLPTPSGSALVVLQIFCSICHHWAGAKEARTRLTNFCCVTCKTETGCLSDSLQTAVLI